MRKTVSIVVGSILGLMTISMISTLIFEERMLETFFDDVVWYLFALFSVVITGVASFLLISDGVATNKAASDTNTEKGKLPLSTKIFIVAMLLFLLFAAASNSILYNRAHDEGYHEGYERAAELYRNEYKNGYDRGHDDGYYEGYVDGLLVLEDTINE